MDVTARNINEKQFHDAWRGYNQEEVDDFLDRVAETLDRVQRENVALQKRLRELDQAVATSRDTEEMLKKTLVTAQKASEEAIASAKAKAEQLISEAEQRVNRANEEARTRMSSLEDDLRRKTIDADREHAAQKRELDSSIDRLRAFETELKQRLKAFLDQQAKSLDALFDDRPKTVPRPEDAANASMTAAPTATPPGRPQAAPVGAIPRPAEAPPAGQPVARPSAQPARQVRLDPDEAEKDPNAAAEAGSPRRGLRGLFWGDES